MNTETKKEKAPNYSESQVKAISAIGNSKVFKTFEEQKAAIEKLAEEWTGAKTPRQILAKLQNLAKTSNGKIVYHKKVYVPKQGGDVTPIKKSELVSHIAELLGVDEESMSSLESATKNVLLVLVGALEKTKELPFEVDETVETE
jgi:hypothetical protein